MFGAWDTALNKLGSKSLLQLRALDWVTDGVYDLNYTVKNNFNLIIPNIKGGLQNFPQITVYHPTDSSNGQ